MSNTQKSTSDVQPCPNCETELPVPKSTRSFICRECDAIIKVIATDDGAVLKVVGKSVEEDPTYQSYEAQVAELVAELDDLHKRYVVEMATKPGPAVFRIGLLGLVAFIAGALTTIWSLTIGGVIGGLGLLVAVAAFVLHGTRMAAFQSRAGEMSKAIERIGHERDVIQRKAALLKVTI